MGTVVHNGDVKVTPLQEGNLSWMFHAEVDPVVSERLQEASETVEKIARSLGKKAGWSGSGLEFHVVDSGTSIAGFAEKDDVTFWVELRRAEAWEKSDSNVGEWAVEAEVAVRCDAVIDCGMHRVAEWPVLVTSSPSAAADAMVEALNGWRSLTPSTRSITGVPSTP